MNNTSTENRKNTMQIVYCLLCTFLLFYVTMLPSALMLDTFVAFGVFCVCHSVLLARKNFLLCIIPCALSVVAIAVSAGISGRFTVVDFTRLVLFAFALAVSAALNGCAVKKASGGVTFVLVTVLMSLLVITSVITVFYEFFGGISVDIINKGLASFNDFYRKVLLDAAMVGVPAGDEATYIAYSKWANTHMNFVVNTIKTSWPSMIAVTGMFMSAFVYILYKPAVKLAKMQDECLSERQWRFSFSKITAVFFELVFFAYLILSFFSKNAVLNISFMNLLSVLMLPFAYIGIRHIAGILKRKFGSKIAAVVVVFVATFILFVLLQGSVIILASLIGSSAILHEKSNDDNNQ